MSAFLSLIGISILGPDFVVDAFNRELRYLAVEVIQMGAALGSEVEFD